MREGEKANRKGETNKERERKELRDQYLQEALFFFFVKAQFWSALNVKTFWPSNVFEGTGRVQHSNNWANVNENSLDKYNTNNYIVSFSRQLRDKRYKVDNNFLVYLFRTLLFNYALVK